MVVATNQEPDAERGRDVMLRLEPGRFVVHVSPADE